MILYHHMEESVWRETVVEKGVFRTDGRRACRFLLDSYRWMAGQMASRIGPPPKNVSFPVWAWHTWWGRPRPDLRFSGHMPPGVPSVQLELDVPDEEVLLSDFDGWHFVLNRGHLSFSEEEFDDCSKAPWSAVTASWEGIFDLERFRDNPDWWGEKREVQACLWEIRADMVKRVRRFVGK